MDPASTILELTPRLEAQQRQLDQDRAALERATINNDAMLLGYLRALLPAHLQNKIIDCHSAIRGWGYSNVIVNFTEYCFHGLCISLDEDGKTVHVEHTEPVLEKCASKSDNPVPEAEAEPEPLSDFAKEWIAEREGYRREAKELETILNEPRAASFRRCMDARRAAAKYYCPKE